MRKASTINLPTAETALGFDTAGVLGCGWVWALWAQSSVSPVAVCRGGRLRPRLRERGLHCPPVVSSPPSQALPPVARQWQTQCHNTYCRLLALRVDAGHAGMPWLQRCSSSAVCSKRRIAEPGASPSPVTTYRGENSVEQRFPARDSSASRWVWLHTALTMNESIDD